MRTLIACMIDGLKRLSFGKKISVFFVFCYLLNTKRKRKLNIAKCSVYSIFKVEKKYYVLMI